MYPSLVSVAQPSEARAGAPRWTFRNVKVMVFDFYVSECRSCRRRNEGSQTFAKSRSALAEMGVLCHGYIYICALMGVKTATTPPGACLLAVCTLCILLHEMAIYQGLGRCTMKWIFSKLLCTVH